MKYFIGSLSHKMQHSKISWKMPRLSRCCFVHPKCTRTYQRASIITKNFRGLYPRTFWREEQPLPHPPPLSIRPHAWVLRTSGFVDPHANFSRTPKFPDRSPPRSRPRLSKHRRKLGLKDGGLFLPLPFPSPFSPSFPSSPSLLFPPPLLSPYPSLSPPLLDPSLLPPPSWGSGKFSTSYIAVSEFQHISGERKLLYFMGIEG